MKRLLLAFTVCIMLLCVPQVAFAKTIDTVPIIFNSQSSGLSAYIEGESVYLPLRNIMNECYVDVDWDNAKKQAKISNGVETTVIERRGNQWYVNGEVAQAEQTPMIHKNQLYLPMQIIQNLCEIRVSWYGGSKVEVEFPLMYTDGEWEYVSNGNKASIKKQMGMCIVLLFIRVR